MDKSNLLNQNEGLNFDKFEKLTLELEEILDEENFIQKDCYLDWQRKFEPVYGKKHTNIHLYAIFAQIFYIAHLFIFQLLLKAPERLENNQSHFAQVRTIQEEFNKDFSTDISFLNPYFMPLFEFMEQNRVSFLEELKEFALKYILGRNIKSEYLFDYLFQMVLKPVLRHISGEFFTPPFLVKMMVKEAYDFGDKVLDPSCGTGNFLIEIVKSILSAKKSEKEENKALNNIYGFDINPMSIFLAIINIVLLVG
ncbi:MAG: hypothetical protein EU535_08725, partial [Promethearchaeota archaeon]